jgi:hypothetical protein
MGACDFMTTAMGKDAADAYRKACDAAEREAENDWYMDNADEDGECCGSYDDHAYNGTISTTEGFYMVRTSAKELKAEIDATVRSLRARLKGMGRGKDQRWKREDLQRRIKGLLATKKNLKANPYSILAAMTDLNKFEKRGACGCIEITGKAAREYKARRGAKGTRQKVFVFGGLAAC